MMMKIAPLTAINVFSSDYPLKDMRRLKLTIKKALFKSFFKFLSE